MYEWLLSVFEMLVGYVVLLLELAGVGLVLYAAGRALWHLCHRERRVRLALAEGIALSLEFKLGAELLRTLTVHEWDDLLILGALLAVRAAMTFLIWWEIRLEKKHAGEGNEGNESVKSESVGNF